MDDHTRTQQSARPNQWMMMTKVVCTTCGRPQRGDKKGAAVTPTSRLTHLRSGGPRGRRVPKAWPTVDPLIKHSEPRRSAHTKLHSKEKTTTAGTGRSQARDGTKPSPRCAGHTTRGDVYAAADSRNDPRTTPSAEQPPNVCCTRPRTRPQTSDEGRDR